MVRWRLASATSNSKEKKNQLNEGLDKGSHAEASEAKPLEPGILWASGFAESHFKDMFEREAPRSCVNIFNGT